MKGNKIRVDRHLKIEATSFPIIFTLRHTHTVYKSSLYFYNSEKTNLTMSSYFRIDGPSRLLHYGGKLWGVQHWVFVGGITYLRHA
jgi:hypothetical protein